MSKQLMPKIAGIAVAASVPLVVLAFWPLYLSRPLASTDRYTHFHATAGSLWLLLLIAQPAAIYFYRYPLHRFFGSLSYVLAPLFVIASGLLSHYRLSQMTDEVFAVEGYAHYLPFYAVIVFSAAYALGLRYRLDADAHGRFMLCTGLPLIDPAIGRVLFFYLPALPSPWLYQAITFTLATVVAAILVFTYRGRASARRALSGYFALLVIMELGWFTVSRTPQWLEAVRWFRGLPLT